MPLEIQDVKDIDFEDMAQYDDAKDDALTAPVALWTWAPENPGRSAWSLRQQQDIFQADSTSKFLKVIDTDKGNEIISLARWHFYDHGYQHPQMTNMELRGLAPEGTPYPTGLNGAFLEALLMPLIEGRQNWMGSGPQWVLTTLVTRASQRKRGAGGMLVKWGVEQAQKDQVPAFLEASALGKSVYERFGFRQVGELNFDVSQFGPPEPITIVRMAYHPPI